MDDETLTISETSQRYNRAVKTIRNTWTRHELWPAPVGRRGRENLYPAAAVADVARAMLPHLDTTGGGDPDVLLTLVELAAELGIAEGTLHGYVARGQWPPPAGKRDGIRLWRRGDVLEHRRTMAARHTKAAGPEGPAAARHEQRPEGR